MCGKMGRFLFCPLQIAIVIQVLTSTVLCAKDYCKSDPERRPYAQNVCSVMREVAAFSSCLNVLPASDVDRYYEACFEYVCRCESDSDKVCLCKPFEAFAAECARLGACSSDWRREAQCPIPTCPTATEVYKVCVPSCKDTCSAKGKEKNDKCDTQIIAEGCFCPDGLVNDANGNCIAQKDCFCEYNGQTYPTGTTITINHQSCVCVSGKFTCTGEPCPVECHADEFQCGDKSKCINKELLVCDDIADCRDHSDEKNCPVSCAVTPCQNDGRCIGRKCGCTAAWMGNYCEIPVPLCPINPCQNGGTCYSGKTDCSFNCECKEGFYGDTCTTPG